MTENVLEIVDFLGLSSVIDSVVGDAVRRGISGSQRKRVNIGMELVTYLNILFLDKPTSGLDSSTSGDVCRLLKSVARRKGLTVAAVIHSQSPVVFDQFDDLLLLGHGGNVVFHGCRTEAPMYFAAIGFPVPKDSSPSDVYMDVISNNIKSKITKKFKPFYLSRYCSYCKRAQTFYADGSNSSEYKHPSTNISAITSSPHFNLRASSYTSLNGRNNEPTSVNPAGSSSTLHLSSGHRGHDRQKSVSMSKDTPLPQQRWPSTSSSMPRAFMSLGEFQLIYDSPPLPEHRSFL
ncbi:hypothetical protein BGZ74_002573 [Mortierella antarctica]|nr:hypothetical protein BGZ74_002573 [Mortierella antarctica]